MGDRLTWVYAVVPADGEDSARIGGTGVADAPVRTVAYRDVRAVVSSVDADEFGQESLQQRLSDPPWLEQVVRDHHRVVSQRFQAGATVPFQLATVYHDDDRVRDMLEHRRAELVAALTVVTRRTEWGVQAFTTPAGEPPTPTASASVEGAGAGTAYLLRRRAQRDSQESARRAAADAANQVHDAVGRLAAAVLRSPAGRTPAGQDGDMVLNAAYLIDDHRRDELTDLVRDLQQRHPLLRMRVTGPWPAYSFVEVGKEGGEEQW